jgi:hypothetical protein
MAEALVKEAITTTSYLGQGASMLFYPAALPLSARTLTYVAGVIRRHRRRGSVPIRPAEVRLSALLVTLDRLIRRLRHRQTAGAPVVGSFGPVVSAGS